jgi:hypothetical protein
MVLHGAREGCELFFPVMELCSCTAVLVVRKIVLPLLVFECMRSFTLKLVCPFGEFNEKKFLSFNPFANNIELRKSLLFFCIELRNTGDLIDDFPAFKIAHFHNAGDIALHHDIISMGLYAIFCKMIDDIALLAEAVIEVIVAVVPVTRLLDPSPDFGTVRKFQCDFCRIPSGIEIDQIGQFFCP